MSWKLRWRHGLRPLFGLTLLYGVPTLLYFRLLWWRGTGGRAFGAVRILGGTGDPVFNLYVLKWGVHQLRLGMPDFWNANFFYPVRGALAFSDHLLGPALQLLLLLDFRLVPNAVAGYNVLLVSSFVLSGLTTGWVLRQSGRSWLASGLGGFLYAFAPTRWAHLEHIQVLLAQWIPLTLWTWDRLLAKATWKRAAVFLPFYLLNLTGGCYLAYMIHLPMLAIAISRGAVSWRALLSRRSVAVLLAVAIVAGGAAALLFAPYIGVSHRYGLERSPSDVALYAVTLASFVAPSETNLYAGLWHRAADRWRFDPSDDESRLFPGFLATGFALLGGWIFLRRPPGAPVRRSPGAPWPWRRAAFAALFGLAAVALVWGDVRTLQDDPPDDAWNAPALLLGLALAGWALLRWRWRAPAADTAHGALDAPEAIEAIDVPDAPDPIAANEASGSGLPQPRRETWLRPWSVLDPWERGMALGGGLCFLLSLPIAFVPLMRVVPGLANLRAPGRFQIFTGLAVAFFAAMGLDRVLPKAGRWRLVVGAGLALSMGLEMAPAVVETRPLRSERDFPAVYRYLRSAGSVGAILELPRLPFPRESIYMYYSTLHWKPIANGYSGYPPNSYTALRELIPVLPDLDGVERLRQLGITHLVVHAGGGPAGREVRARLPAWERDVVGREVALVFTAGMDRVYVVLDGPVRLGPLAVLSSPGLGAGAETTGGRGAGVGPRIENLFYGQTEDAGEAEGERQAGVVAAGFDGVDGLPRNAETIGKLGLRPAAFRAQDAQVVGHSALPRQ